MLGINWNRCSFKTALLLQRDYPANWTSLYKYKYKYKYKYYLEEVSIENCLSSQVKDYPANWASLACQRNYLYKYRVHHQQESLSKNDFNSTLYHPDIYLIEELVLSCTHSFNSWASSGVITINTNPEQDKTRFDAVSLEAHSRSTLRRSYESKDLIYKCV